MHNLWLINVWKRATNTHADIHTYVSAEWVGSPDISHTPDSEALQSLSLSLTDCSFTIEGVCIQKCRASTAITQLWGAAGFVRRSRETLERGRDPRFKSEEKPQTGNESAKETSVVKKKVDMRQTAKKIMTDRSLHYKKEGQRHRHYSCKLQKQRGRTTKRLKTE